MSMETLEQKRARHAWKAVSEARRSLGPDEYTKYVGTAKGLPALIMNSGLMQAMAFMHSKDKRHNVLAGQLRNWLHGQNDTPEDFSGFMEHLSSCRPGEFQAITTEAFNWLKWLRHMAAARARGD
ncbi:MAG TPA: type III-B CRISPR module-associated protein Cmr5 [Wenzhouxiangella sp.]|nr:type III-B CRISPR module-associated protein Cmr5 [Wenzhouxiangella sp.]